MSLYYETTEILENTKGQPGTLKSRVYGKKDLKSSPGTVFALASEATKWSAVLKEVIERSGLLSLEKKVGNTLKRSEHIYPKDN